MTRGPPHRHHATWPSMGYGSHPAGRARGLGEHPHYSCLLPREDSVKCLHSPAQGEAGTLEKEDRQVRGGRERWWGEGDCGCDRGSRARGPPHPAPAKAPET